MFPSVTTCSAYCFLYLSLYFAVEAPNFKVASFGLTVRNSMLFSSPRNYCGSGKYLNAQNGAKATHIWGNCSLLAVATLLSSRPHLRNESAVIFIRPSLYRFVTCSYCSGPAYAIEPYYSSVKSFPLQFRHAEKRISDLFVSHVDSLLEISSRAHSYARKASGSVE